MAQAQAVMSEMEPVKTKKLSEILDEVFDPHRGVTTFGELVDGLDHHGMALVLVLFSIPSALPVPAAGYSTLLSIPLLAIGFRLILGRETVWLPQRVREKSFDPAKLEKAHRMMQKLVRFIERFSKPRLTFLTDSKMTAAFLGVLICLQACSMVLPIPGTNSLPAGGIFLIGFGLLEKDGLMLLLGVLYSIVALALSVFIILFGYEVVKEGIKALM